MEQPLGAQCSAQEEPGLHIWNPQALEDLAVQTSKEHRGCESGILLNLGKRRHFTQSGDHSQSPENRGLIKKKKNPSCKTHLPKPTQASEQAGGRDPFVDVALTPLLQY